MYSDVQYKRVYKVRLAAGGLLQDTPATCLHSPLEPRILI